MSKIIRSLSGSLLSRPIRPFDIPQWNGRSQYWQRSQLLTPENVYVPVAILRKRNRNGWTACYFLILQRDEQTFYIPVQQESYLTSPTGSAQTTNSGLNATWNNLNNAIETIGGGGSGACISNGISGGQTTGGAGGEYSRVNNFAITSPGVTTFQWFCGGGAASQTKVGNVGGSGGAAGGATYWNGTAFNVATVGSDGGNGGLFAISGTPAGGQGGGAGGHGSGTVHNNGGGGGSCTSTTATPATGAGGAGGPNGAGNAGVDAATSTATNGGSADAGSGGAAGAGRTTAGVAGSGGAGTEFNSTHGSGGGGGGVAASSTGTIQAGDGGLYGGGGAASNNRTSGSSTSTSITGAGAQGLIRFTWVPKVASMLVMF